MKTNMETAHDEASSAAAKAAQAYSNEYLGGGDNFPCGFAWVERYPAAKGNTRDGKAERRLLESVGFSKDYTGKAWRLSNPSKWFGQNVTAKFLGAEAYAKKMKELTGLSFYAADRLD